MRVAALDLGSNTFLLLVAEVKPGHIKVLRDETRFVRLGQGVDKNKVLSKEALVRAEHCFKEFAQIIAELKVEQKFAYATSAARDAENGNEFLKLGQRFGFHIQIVSGSQEAEITFKGATAGLKSGVSRFVVDVGGGSTEIIGKNSAGEIRGFSFDVGSVRLSERFKLYGKVSSGQLDDVSEYLHSQFQQHPDIFSGAKSLEVIAVAGTPVTLKQLELQSAYNERVIDGSILTIQTIDFWLQKLSLLEGVERQQLAFMPEGRGDVLLAGCLILRESLRTLNVTQTIVSTKGVRYGILYQNLDLSGAELLSS